jgi:sulfur carrier protein
VTVELNGERVELEDGASVAEAVAESGADPDAKGVAAAVDGEVVPKGQWRTTKLSDGQHVEVVRAIQGG